MVYGLRFCEDFAGTNESGKKWNTANPIWEFCWVNIKLMIFFLQSLGLSLAHNMLCDYLQSGVVTTLNSTTGNILNAEFPALHICNSYQIRSKKQLFLSPLQPMHSLLPFGQHCQHDSPKFSKINLPLCCENKFMHFHLKRLWNSVQHFFGN